MIEQEDNLIYDLLSQLLSLVINDDIFVLVIKDKVDFYTADSIHWRGIQMKISE